MASRRSTAARSAQPWHTAPAGGGWPGQLVVRAAKQQDAAHSAPHDGIVDSSDFLKHLDVAQPGQQVVRPTRGCESWATSFGARNPIICVTAFMNCGSASA